MVWTMMENYGECRRTTYTAANTALPPTQFNMGNCLQWHMHRCLTYPFTSSAIPLSTAVTTCTAQLPATGHFTNSLAKWFSCSAIQRLKEVPSLEHGIDNDGELWRMSQDNAPWLSF
eukprot:s4693_g7.t1